MENTFATLSEHLLLNFFNNVDLVMLKRTSSTLYKVCLKISKQLEENNKFPIKRNLREQVLNCGYFILYKKLNPNPQDIVVLSDNIANQHHYFSKPHTNEDFAEQLNLFITNLKLEKEDAYRMAVLTKNDTFTEWDKSMFNSQAFYSTTHMEITIGVVEAICIKTKDMSELDIQEFFRLFIGRNSTLYTAAAKLIADTENIGVVVDALVIHCIKTKTHILRNLLDLFNVFLNIDIDNGSFQFDIVIPQLRHVIKKHDIYFQTSELLKITSITHLAKYVGIPEIFNCLFFPDAELFSNYFNESDYLYVFKYLFHSNDVELLPYLRWKLGKVEPKSTPGYLSFDIIESFFKCKNIEIRSLVMCYFEKVGIRLSLQNIHSIHPYLITKDDIYQLHQIFQFNMYNSKLHISTIKIIYQQSPEQLGLFHQIIPVNQVQVMIETLANDKTRLQNFLKSLMNFPNFKESWLETQLIHHIFLRWTLYFECLENVGIITESFVFRPSINVNFSKITNLTLAISILNKYKYFESKDAFISLMKTGFCGFSLNEKTIWNCFIDNGKSFTKHMSKFPIWND